MARSRAMEKSVEFLANLKKMTAFAEKFAIRSGTRLQPNLEAREAVLQGLARHMEKVQRPLCPCNFYEDKAQEAKSGRWICPCEEMQQYKYCHCLLFCGEEGLPITEYLPQGHEGLEIYGVTSDPDPSRGRSMQRLQEVQGRVISKARVG
jgi:ferredoxin-thioredoxin reductase catalytic chain